MSSYVFSECRGSLPQAEANEDGRFVALGALADVALEVTYAHDTCMSPFTQLVHVCRSQIWQSTQRQSRFQQRSDYENCTWFMFAFARSRVQVLGAPPDVLMVAPDAAEEKTVETAQVPFSTAHLSMNSRVFSLSLFLRGRLLTAPH